jgi:outer membrane lipoprotein-sorting protein
VFTLQFSVAQVDAESIMVKAKNRLFENGISKFDFSISFVNAKAGIHQNKKGTLLASENKYFLSLPDDQLEIFFDGKSKWNVAKDDQEIVITDLEEDEEEDISFSKYFDDYKKLYTISGEDLKFGNYRVTLTPKDKNDEMQKVEILLKSYEIQTITQYSKSGSIVEIKINKYEADKQFSTSPFKPNMANYPQYEVDDLR